MTEAQAVILAEHLLERHGLTAQGWTFGLVKRVRNIGTCYYRQKLITLSVYFLHDDVQVRDTILHEIAHALVGPFVKSHGVEWQRKAVELGCEPTRCGRIEAQATPRYKLVCGTCGVEHPMYRKPRQLKSCGKCCPKVYNPAYRLTVERL
jgi:predicted SprT family Zn-dependent metalloprotease